MAYVGLLASIGVVILLLAFSVMLPVGYAVGRLKDQSRLGLAAVLSTISGVLLMGLIGAMTAAAVELSEGAMSLGLAGTAVFLIMFASGFKQAVQDNTPSLALRFLPLLAGLATLVFVIATRPVWIVGAGGFVLGIVSWLMRVPVLGWIAAGSGGLFVLWSMGAVIQLVVVMIAGSATAVASQKE